MEKYKMTMQHSQVSIDDIKTMGTDCAILISMFNDRMKSSINNNFKDDNGYFIIFSIKEINEIFGWSKSKIMRVLKKLRNFGMITTKHIFNKANHIYLPKFSVYYESVKMTPSKVSKSESNQSNLNHNTSDITVDTEKQTGNQASVVQTKTENKVEQHKQSSGQPKSIDNLRTALIEKTKLPVNAVDEVIEFANHDYDKAYELFGIINQAKYYVAKHNDLLGKPVASYEHNKNIQSKIAWKLKYLFNYAKNAKKINGYLMNGLKTFFLDAFGLVKDELIEPVAESKQKPKINNEIPDWMKEEYDSSNDFSAEKQARIKKEMMSKLKSIDDKYKESQPVRSETKQRKTCTLAEHLANNAVLGV